MMPQTATIGERQTSRPAMTDEDKKAASVLLDEAGNTFDPNLALRCRVVAAVLYGQEYSKIVRNLGVTEKMIQSCKAKYDEKGLEGLK